MEKKMTKVMVTLIRLQLFAAGFYPFNPTLGQKMQTDVNGVEVDMAYMAHLQVTAAQAIAASAVGCHAAITQAAIAQDITTGITNPLYPRNVTIKGNAVGNAGNVVITGTNFADEVITETIALNAATEVLGNKAFKTVTKITLPAETHVGTDTVSIGFGDKLGLPFKLTHNTLFKGFLNNVLEGTAATITVSATLIESNTFDLNSALNGSIIDLYFLV